MIIIIFEPVTTVYTVTAIEAAQLMQSRKDAAILFPLCTIARCTHSLLWTFKNLLTIRTL